MPDEQRTSLPDRSCAPVRLGMVAVSNHGLKGQWVPLTVAERELDRLRAENEALNLALRNLCEEVWPGCNLDDAAAQYVAVAKAQVASDETEATQ